MNGYGTLIRVLAYCGLRWGEVSGLRVMDVGLARHELRHTPASLAVSSGAHVKAVQRSLGHAPAAVTLDVYSDLFDDDLDSVAQALDHHIRRVTVAKVLSRPEKGGGPE